MAKSKTGGSRAFLSGKLGADVYSIGKDGSGRKQQVVRSLAESVANPQTQAQMFGRMVMSTVMQAASAMRYIVDHSFDGVPNGQPSLSRFISRNYALIAADAKAHPAAGNFFALSEYKVKGMRMGQYLMSEGDETPIPSSVLDLSTAADNITAILCDAGETVASLKAKMNLGDDDYFTLVQSWVTPDHVADMTAAFRSARFKFNPAVAGTTVISNANVNSIFLKEVNGLYVDASGGLEFADNQITFFDGWRAFGCIVSRKHSDGYHHSTCQMEYEALTYGNADQVLPTYPVGTAMFLNGGDI